MSDILVEPGAVHDDPPPRPETRTDPQTQPEADDRLRRDAAAKRRVDEANGMNWFFHEAEARARSRVVFALGNKAERN